MVDLHCHILPNLDDGATSMEESQAMAETAIAEGITHVVATPHANSEYPFAFENVRRLRDELQAQVGRRLALATGCDFHLSPENLDALRKNPTQYCINQKDCLLVEFNEFSITPAMDQTLHQLQLARLRPVITHPERNAIVRAQPERLRQWVRLGCFVQVTAGSITGVFGPGAQQNAVTWIGEGLVHFVSSDAHNTRNRPLKLQAAFEAVAEQFGKEKAQALFVENPLAAFEGRELPHVPEISEELPPMRRKRFFFF